MRPLIEMNEMHDDAWMIREINSFLLMQMECNMMIITGSQRRELGMVLVIRTT